jgi:hypothetical protein
MYRRLIIFLLRKKFGLKKFQAFRFKNQKSKVNTYCFTDVELLKEDVENCIIRPSNVKLNYLLSDECQIEKVGIAVGN